MVDYTFSSHLNQTITGFNPASDVLLFLSGSGSAADVTVTEAGGATTFRTSAGTVTLSGVSMAQLSPTNVNFANGSRMYTGDGTTATLLDSLGQAAATYVLTTANDHVMGLGGNDTINIAEVTGNDKVNGNAGDDNITVTSASTGNHNIWGGAGVDTISIEGSGANHVFGDNGNDLITITGSGANQANGNADNDSISVSGGGANIVRGGKGTDTLTLGATATGTNQAWGDDGADSINIIAGANGKNTIMGGAGNDSITVAGTGANSVNGNADSDSITISGSGANTVNGGAGTDSISITGAGANVVYGDNGADTITGVFTGGAAVLATVFGGADADTFRLSYSAQAHRTIIGDFASTDIAQVTLSAGSATSLAVTGGGSSPTITNGASEQISFSGYTGNFNGTNFVLSDSTILATNFGNTAGTLTGGALADHLIAGNGGDVLNGAVGADKMIGGSGNDIFMITAVAELAAGETITGGAGTDVVRIVGTTAGTTTLTSTTDVERVEIATGTAAAGVYSGTTAHDIVATATTVWGGTQTGIWMQGNDGANSLTGSTTGNDTFVGGAGVDTYALGGAGNGADVAGFMSTGDVSSNNTITNFDMSADRFGFSTTLTGLTAGNLSATNYGEANITGSAGLDDGLITTAVNGLANIASLKVLALVDNDGGAQAFTAVDIDLGLKNSNATGAGFILALLDDASATAATLYYDPNFDNNGDIVLVGTVTTVTNNLTLANVSEADFTILSA